MVHRRTRILFGSMMAAANASTLQGQDTNACDCLEMGLPECHE